MRKQWWKESVVYQIYPRSFMDSNDDGIGDLGGIRMKLDYLKELGVDVIWLCPVYQSPNDDNGYDISDYYKIMDEFGGMEEWKKLLHEVHERGMKLIMDLVVNHTSDEHPWFIESRKSKENPYRDYYIWRKGKDGKEPNNWESFFSGSAWQYDEETGEYYLHLFSKKQPDLNWENKQVREEIYRMMTWWLDQGIDGFRMDVINLLSKDPNFPDAPQTKERRYQWGGAYFMNGPKIHEILQEMNRRVFSNYSIMTVGETPGVTPEDALLYVGEDRNELNLLFQFELMDIDSGPSGKWEIRKWDAKQFKEIICKWQTALMGKGWNSLYLNNHDQPRMVSRFGDDGRYRVESAKMLATLLHTQQGTPFIFQGEEIGMTNVRFPSIEDYRDIETFNFYQEKMRDGKSEQEVMEAIYRKGRDNARTPMQWDSTANAGFTKGTPWIAVNPNYRQINVEEAIKDPDSIYHYYRKLIALRRKYPVFIYGSFRPLDVADENIFAYEREWNGDRLVVLLHLKGDHAILKAEEVDYFIGGELILTNGSGRKLEKGKDYTLQPYEARVYYFRG